MPEPQPAPVPAIGTPAFFADPYRTYRALLDSGTRALRLSPHMVVVTHYQDCLDTLRDPRLSARRYVRQLAHFTPEQKAHLADWTNVAAHQMFFMDPPEHTRVRKLLHRAFSPETLAAMVPRIEVIFRELLDRVPAGVEIDFMRSLAHPFPALVIGEILGFPRDDWDRLMHWSDIFIEFVAMFQPSFELALTARQATIEMSDYLRALIADKRRHPADDVVSFMIASQEDGDALSEQELISQCMLLLVAGHETTRNLIGNGLSVLLRHPDAMAQLRADPSIMRSAVEEFLRFEGPLQGTSRIATEDIEFHGESVRAGQALTCMMACANRDGGQFPDPDRLDLTRKNNSHLDFGAGAHACLGLHLARIEAQIAIRALLARFPRIELREDPLPWSQTLTLRGLKRLNVVLG